MNVDSLPALGDNLIYLLTDGSSVAVIDPGDSRPVVEAVSGGHVTLELILVTHSHFDHTGGCGELKRMSGCRVIGPAGTPGLDEVAAGGASVPFSNACLEVIAVPGHTGDGVAYHPA